VNASDVQLGGHGSLGLGEATMKHTIMWLALALLFAISATLSLTAGAFRQTATMEATDPATTQEAARPADIAITTPAPQGVPVAFLDDVPPLKPTQGAELIARWSAEPGPSPEPRAVERTTLLPPLSPATTGSIASQPRQDSRSVTKPPETDAQPSRKPKDSNAELPDKHSKRATNARACASAAPSRFADLLRRLNLAPRCAPRRSAA